MIHIGESVEMPHTAWAYLDENDDDDDEPGFVRESVTGVLASAAVSLPLGARRTNVKIARGHPRVTSETTL